jgi:hypothetical protein
LIIVHSFSSPKGGPQKKGLFGLSLVPGLLWFFPKSRCKDDVIEEHPDIPEKEPTEEIFLT